MTNLPQMLAQAAKRKPHKTAIIDGAKQYTYLGLWRQVHSLSHRLAGMGVGRGDAVVLLLPNSAEFVASFLAVARLGAVVVPLNTHYQHHELTQYLDDSAASVLVTVREHEERGRLVVENLAAPCGLLVLDGPVAWEPGPAHPIGGYGEIIAGGLGIQPGDPVIFQYSSGSTGHPKRIVRSHANLVFELNSLAKTMGVCEEDRFLGVAPFSHVNGLARSMLASLSVGATLVVLRDFMRQKVISTIEQEKITVFIGVPFMFGILADTNFRQPVNLSSVRLCVSASAPMPVAANRKFKDKYGIYVRQLYGSTETGTISVNMGGDIEDSLGSVGLPIEGVEVTVLGEGGLPLSRNETGEVAVKSPAAITQYQGRTQETEAFRDGYFLTGDLGRFDESDKLYLVGRKKFFINRGGYKINPWELETLIGAHPKVEEVVVVGVPTTYGDERVKAIIVPRTNCSAQEIIAHCSGKIAGFKVPSLVEFRQNLPKTSTGKILRTEL